MTTATVFLNTHPDNFRGFKPEHADFLKQVVCVKYNAEPRELLRMLFEELNVGGTELELALALAHRYFAQVGNRSLSVGDVIDLDGTAYACASVGWTELEPGVVARARLVRFLTHYVGEHGGHAVTIHGGDHGVISYGDRYALTLGDLRSLLHTSDEKATN